MIEDVSYCEKSPIWEFLPDSLSEEELMILDFKKANFTKKEICEKLDCPKRELDQKIARLIKKLKNDDSP